MRARGDAPDVELQEEVVEVVQDGEARASDRELPGPLDVHLPDPLFVVGDLELAAYSEVLGALVLVLPEVPPRPRQLLVGVHIGRVLVVLVGGVRFAAVVAASLRPPRKQHTTTKTITTTTTTTTTTAATTTTSSSS